MEALSLIPFSLDSIEEAAEPKPWRDRLLEAVRRTVEFCQNIADTPIEGTLWPIVISLISLALLIAGAYLTGWEHAVAGP
jgi:hypothetical protein